MWFRSIPYFKIVSNNGFSTSVGDEGGFAPNLHTIEEASVILLKLSDSNYVPGKIYVLP